ncbi:terpenoid synthase [Stemphylium lycopersici]|nr:terpenoid synthase [Stemphylium lycopersici]
MSTSDSRCLEARSDWTKYIGPTEQFGGCNPINGNLTAVALPLTKPERLRLIAYVFKYAFFYDDGVEQEQPNTSNVDGNQKLEWKNAQTLGKMQMQAKMMTQLSSMDSACTERIKRAWREMLSTTLRDKDKKFDSLEDYMDFRIVDVAGAWTEAILLFGMGMTLSEEEDAQLECIRKSCYAALGLANDYFSFDREYADFQKPGESQTFINSVWLHMQWHNVDVAAAKRMTVEVTRRYEGLFLNQCAKYRHENSPLPEKLDSYLDGLAYLISGNVVWSLNCPRYHPEHRYDPNAGVEDDLTANSLARTLGTDYGFRGTLNAKDASEKDTSVHFTPESEHSRRSSTETLLTAPDDDGSSRDDNISTSSCILTSSSSEKKKQSMYVNLPSKGLLGSVRVQAPFDYIASLPSKGVRDTFIDALNLWLGVSEPVASRIKSLGGRLFTASLMIDDIEDGSNLRRGQPAAHTVFGTAQTINSGCYEILQAVNEAQQLGPGAVKIVLEELDELHIGQSYDLYWTHHIMCPSEDEYLEMVMKKTGALFRLLARLLLAHTRTKTLAAPIENLVILVGIQYQIRDDYQNLHSEEYAAQKGSCEDLDEGKFSFPLIHAMSTQSTSGGLLRELLLRRRDLGYLPDEHKKPVLEQFDRAGSMAYTRETLKRLQGEVYDRLEMIEDATKQENWILRALLQRLEV